MGIIYIQIQSLGLYIFPPGLALPGVEPPPAAEHAVGKGKVDIVGGVLECLIQKTITGPVILRLPETIIFPAQISHTFIPQGPLEHFILLVKGLYVSDHVAARPFGDSWLGSSIKGFFHL